MRTDLHDLAQRIGRVIRKIRIMRIVSHSLCLVLLLGLVAPHSASTQELPWDASKAEKNSAEGVDHISAEQIGSRLALVRNEIAGVEARRANADAAQSGHFDRVLLRLREIEDVLAKQAQIANSQPKPEAKRAPSVAPAPSVFALNALLEAQSGPGIELVAARKALADAKEKFDVADRSRRKARIEWEQADGASKLDAEQTFERRRIDARLAQENVHLRTLEVRAAQHAGASLDADSMSPDAVVKMRTRLSAGEGDSRDGFDQLTALEGNLRRERESAERLLATAELQLDAAEKRFSRLADPPAKILEEINALAGRRDAVRQQIALADAQLERLASQRQIWRHWDELLRGGDSKGEFSVWVKSAEDRIERLKDDRLRGAGRIADLETRLQELDERLTEVGAEPRLRSVLEEQRQTLSQLEQAQRAEAQRLAADQALTERFLQDIRGQEAQTSLVEYAARFGRAATAFWVYEITTIDDEPITVGSLALAFFFFGIGLWAARRGSAFVGRMARERFKVDIGGANALQTLSFYLLLVSFMLMALRVVHFPLTAFTVLGGAAAIGIGFGSQNVMNNFISGLILMLERPVRARDVVEVDGNHGIIESIGARSTQIRSTDGRHIVVPNSFFLESNVVNWTLSDDLIRGKVTVGVVYGSPTRLVEDLIRGVVDEESQVLKTPAPIILFSEFGDNSLNFEVYFWVRARSPMEVSKVQSLVRFRIDDLFREHDLVIAFPQRDVHLDSVSPIEVRVVGDANAQATEIE